MYNSVKCTTAHFIYLSAVINIIVFKFQSPFVTINTWKYN